MPEENLDRYRAFARTARQIETLSGTVHSHGKFDEASRLCDLAAKYWGMANALRVDLPTA